LALGAGVAALPAYADSPVTDTYTVSGAESTPSNVTVQSGGLIDITSPSGALSNSHVLATEAGGSINNAGSLTTTWYLNNAGILTNQASGSINNHKVVDNQTGGTFSNAGTLSSNLLDR